MKFVLLCGPQAVGKMTVGQELAKRTGLKLFHNHMTIDLVAPFFSYSSSTGKRLVNLFREEIFGAFAKSDEYGMIFTFVWAFDMQEDWGYVNHIFEIFEEQGAEIYIAELEAGVETRLSRNNTPNRLLHKPTKRDLTFTERDIKTSTEKYRLNSQPGEITIKNYIRIKNETLSPEETAQQIRQAFAL